MRNALEGTYNGEYTICPVNCQDDRDCPYAQDGICHAPDPVASCEDFAMFFPTWESWTEA